jgi:DNA-binding HxlR family transcriptional regulator
VESTKENPTKVGYLLMKFGENLKLVLDSISSWACSIEPREELMPAGNA